MTDRGKLVFSEEVRVAGQESQNHTRYSECQS